MHKINFITHFFFKILQRNKTCCFGLFGPARPDTPKMMVPIWRNLWYLSAGEKSTLSFTFSLRYCEDIVKACYFRYLGHAWLHTPKVIYYQFNENLTPMFSWRYCKDMQTSYFEYFELVWLNTPKLIVST